MEEIMLKLLALLISMVLTSPERGFKVQRSPWSLFLCLLVELAACSVFAFNP